MFSFLFVSFEPSCFKVLPVVTNERNVTLENKPMRMSVKFGVIAAMVIAGVLGCGPKEEKLYRVSGTVTFGGKPIPKGRISFDPTTDGPMGFASIEDGKYDTEQVGGVRGGKYNIRVNGFNGIPGPDLPFGQALFLEYTTATELPAADSTYDLEITKVR